MDTIDSAGGARRARGQWLQSIGAGALGVLIGFSLGMAAAPPSPSSPLQAAPLHSLPAAPPQASVAGPSDAGVAGYGASAGQSLSWTDPAPGGGGLEPCWAARETVSC